MQIPSPKMAAVRAILILVLLCFTPSLAWAQSTPIYTYDSNYQQEPGVIDAPGSVTSMTYDTTGGQTGLVVDSDVLGVETRYYYDNNGNVTHSVIEPSDVTSSTYDTADNDLITGDGNQTVYRYDSTGNQVQAITTGERIISTVYDSQDNLIVVGTENSLGQTTETYYDSTGNVVGSFDPLGSVTAVTYDGVGRDMVVAADISGQNTISVYDGSGNVIETFTTAFPVTSLAYASGPNDLIAASESQPNITVYLPNQNVGPQDGISYGPSFSQIPTPGPPTIITYGPTNKSLFVAVTPESSSLALIAPALLLLLGMAILRVRKVNQK